MWKILLETFDIICAAVWIIFLIINRMFFWAYIILGRCLFVIWFVLSLVWPFSAIAGNVNSFFRELHKVIQPLFKLISRWYKKLLEKISASQILKRPAFIVIFALCVLLIYPPAYWGEWKLAERGIASYYGPGFFFHETASTERYYPWRVTAASLTLPLGTVAKVVNRYNGLTVYVEINDRGPYVKGRILDLSFMAALRLGMLRHGLVPVDIYVKEKNGAFVKK